MRYYIERIRNNRIVNVLVCMIIVAFCTSAIYSFVSVPFSGDLQVFMAAANQVKYQTEDGILAIFQAWELKGVGNRVLMYVIYRIADFLAGYNNTLKFQIAAKSIYAILIMLVFAISAILTSEKKRERLKIFLIYILIFFCTYTTVQLQAEMTCIALCILVLACLTNAQKRFWLLSGIIGSFLFFFKSVFVLMYFAAVLAALLYNGKKVTNIRYLVSGITFLFSEIILCGITFFIYPREFEDMSMASEFQTTLFSENSKVNLGTILNNFADNFLQSSIACPCLLIGMICAIMLIVRYAKTRENEKLVLLFSCWLIPMDIIIVSNCYFVYHYFLLSLPSFISIILLIKDFQYNKWEIAGAMMLSTGATACWWILKYVKDIDLFNASTILLIITHVLLFGILIAISGEIRRYMWLYQVISLSICFFLWTTYSSFFSIEYRNLRRLTERSIEICAYAFPQDFSDEPVLFLDDGKASFYKSVPSYSRYFFDLPLQRWNQGDDWKVQQEEYEKVLAYDGKYIVIHSGWFNLEKYPDLEDKINTEYKKLENGGLYFHSPDGDYFTYQDIPDIAKVLENSEVYILVRND